MLSAVSGSCSWCSWCSWCRMQKDWVKSKSHAKSLFVLQGSIWLITTPLAFIVAALPTATFCLGRPLSFVTSRQVAYPQGLPLYSHGCTATTSRWRKLHVVIESILVTRESNDACRRLYLLQDFSRSDSSRIRAHSACSLYYCFIEYHAVVSARSGHMQSTDPPADFNSYETTLL